MASPKNDATGFNPRSKTLRERHGRIAAALLDEAQAGLPREPNRYIQSHLAGHVAESDLWSALATQPEVLDRLDPDSVAAGVLAYAFGRAGETLPAEVAATVSVRHLLGPLRPEERALTRKIAMTRLGKQADQRAFGSPVGVCKARLAWALLQPAPAHVVLTWHTGGVSALAALNRPEGHSLLASGSWGDNTVRLWDPATGAAFGAPLTGHTGGVTSLAVVTLPSGRCLLASGSEDNTVRMWDPATSFFSRMIARLIAIWDRTMRQWDPADSTAFRAPLTRHTHKVTALTALTLPDGRCLLAFGSDDHTVRMWDLATGTAFRAPLTGHTNEVTALAALNLPDGRCLLASGSRDHTVRLWDPANGAAVGAPLTGHTDLVTALAALRLPDGRCLLASSSDDCTVRLWDLPSGRRLSVWGVDSRIKSLVWADGKLFVGVIAGLFAIEVGGV